MITQNMTLTTTQEQEIFCGNISLLKSSYSSFEVDADESDDLFGFRMTNVTCFSTYEDAPTLPIANSIIAAYLLSIVVASVLSNSLVMLVLSAQKKKLRPFQMCLLSLAVSDVLFSLMLHPMSIATALGSDPKFIFNSGGCLFFGVFALFFGTYDMVIHCVLSVLRYINICHPGKVEWVSRRAILSILTGSVLYSMMWSIGPVFGWGKYETFEVGCTIAFEDRSISGKTFVTCAFIFVFFFPLAVTITSYTAILLEVDRQRRILNKLGRVICVGTSRLDVEMKLVKLSLIVAAWYVIAWFPYAIVCMWQAYGDANSLPWTFKILASLFCKSATASNPFIYFFFSSSFRKETMQTLRRLAACRSHRLQISRFSSSSQRTSSSLSSSLMSFKSRASRASRRERGRSFKMKKKTSVKEQFSVKIGPVESSV